MIDFVRQTKPKMLATCHHDPESNDQKVAEMANAILLGLNEQAVNDVLVFPGREGMTVDVTKPKRPLDLN